MNWELYAVILVWISFVWFMFKSLLNLWIITDHNKSSVVKVGLTGEASLNTWGKAEIVLSVVLGVFLAVYYFG